MKTAPRLIVKHFDADQYTAVFNPRTGFFARAEDDGVPEPFWSSHGPELLDIAVTNWCDGGAIFAIESRTPTGPICPSRIMRR